MEDENRTRIIRPQEPKAADAPTQKLATAEPQEEMEPKTRLLSGYGNTPQSASDVAPEDVSYELTVGWLVVIEGPGKGCSCEIFYGMNSIGRGKEERISLDFGDTAISREAHAYVTFDEKQSKFYISHGGKSNLVRLNDAPVLAAEPLSAGDRIEIGKTMLMFVPFCGESFSWEGTDA